MNSMLYMVITGVIIVAAIILILVVLVQKSKGGGLASGFASSNQIMGVRKTTDFVEKATWSLAGAIVVLSLASTLVLRSDKMGGGTIDNDIEIPVLPGSSTPDVANPIPVEEAPAE